MACESKSCLLERVEALRFSGIHEWGMRKEDLLCRPFSVTNTFDGSDARYDFTFVSKTVCNLAAVSSF